MGEHYDGPGGTTSPSGSYSFKFQRPGKDGTAPLLAVPSYFLFFLSFHPLLFSHVFHERHDLKQLPFSKSFCDLGTKILSDKIGRAKRLER
jgi:hypothetical protein